MSRTGPIAAVLLAAAVALVAVMKRSASESRIETSALGGGVAMLTGSGGNLAVFTGEDGVLLVDDQIAPLTADIIDAITKLSDRPVDYVLNTHYHGDHVGGNENFGEAGAVIIAQDNVRARMATTQVSEFLDRTTPPYPDAALPVITFTDTVRFHLNGDRVHVVHVPHAHTDGDAIVHFEKANVLHMGDAFWNGYYPFIDFEAGGTIDGLIAAVDRGLNLADGDTRIIPGHGPLGDREALQAFRDVLAAARARVARARAAGQGLEQIQAAGLTREWDEDWGGWFIKPDPFVESIYRSLP